ALVFGAHRGAAVFVDFGNRLAGRGIYDFHRVVLLHAWRARGSHRAWARRRAGSRRPDRGIPDAIARRTRTKVPTSAAPRPGGRAQTTLRRPGPVRGPWAPARGPDWFF